MKIETRPPAVRRGVTQLMYVGDDDAVERVVPQMSAGKKLAIGVGIGFLLYLLR